MLSDSLIHLGKTNYKFTNERGAPSGLNISFVADTFESFSREKLYLGFMHLPNIAINAQISPHLNEHIHFKPSTKT